MLRAAGYAYLCRQIHVIDFYYATLHTFTLVERMAIMSRDAALHIMLTRYILRHAAPFFAIQALLRRRHAAIGACCHVACHCFSPADIAMPVYSTN